MRTIHALAIAAALGLAAAGAARADDPRVPRTGSEQPIAVPHALPGADVHHPDAPHLAAPTGLTPRSAEGGLTPPNAVAGARAQIGESRPHADVTADPGAVPNAAEGSVGPRR